MFTSSTFELIFLAASNSHILFCFCNLIIAILLIGTKPVFSFHRQVTNPPPVFTVNEGSHYMVDNDMSIIGTPIITQNAMVDDGDHETADVDDGDDKQNVSIVNKEHTREDDDEEEEEMMEEEDCEGDELRRRVEEFINKTNKAWEAEKLGHIPIYSS
ncbi:uncharacterized protein LOC124932845 [Impatiens glandulifera]|uniref:uncharacterized protein LOC124932845 n=1 Tax=Impatiens glandulifera TaxID=253017 RepID=UPI001FB0BA6D|nr:uncharacterized protein LOC124932845 [Impatiens glandulifera]